MRQEPLIDTAAADVKAEVAPSMGRVKPDAPRCRLTGLGHQPPIGIQDSPRIGGKVVRENVPVIQEGQ